jgi:Holliday junction resolvase RusA-like endonuclease
VISFFVPGTPKPQGSKKGFINKKTGQVIIAEQLGQPHKDWRAVVALAASEYMDNRPPIEGPVSVSIAFQMPRPKSHGKKLTWPMAQGDIDKLARSILDAITHVILVDDKQVLDLHLAKVWARPDEAIPVGARIQVTEVVA